MHRKDETFVARTAINVALKTLYRTFETSLAHLDKRAYSHLFLHFLSLLPLNKAINANFSFFESAQL